MNFKIVILFTTLLSVAVYGAGSLTLTPEPSDGAVVECTGDALEIVSHARDQMTVDCHGSSSSDPSATPEIKATATAISTATATAEPTATQRVRPTVTPTATATSQPTATARANSGELLLNWQLHNATDGQGNLYCETELTQTIPRWASSYFSFRGTWNEDPDPDGCVARTMGETYPDNSNQANYIPVGATGTLWQVAAAPQHSAVILSSVYGQHESGTIHWSLWDCPGANATSEQCSLIYRTDGTLMRIPFLDTKECSAYEMELRVATSGNVTWSAEKVLETCPGEPIAPVEDTIVSFTAPAFIGVLHEITPRSDGDGMSGVKIGHIKLSVE